MTNFITNPVWSGIVQNSTGEYINVARTSEGSSVIASSFYDVNGRPEQALDGTRHTNNAWDTPAQSTWRSNTASNENIEVNFNQTRKIQEINVITLDDSVNYNSDPNITDTFTLYGITDFNLEYYDGASWTRLETITSNNKVWRQFTYSPFNAEKIRLINIYGLTGACRLVEFEAWGFN